MTKYNFEKVKYETQWSTNKQKMYNSKPNIILHG